MASFDRRLTLFDLTLIACGGAIGSGIFRTPSQVAAALPSAGWIFAAWGLGGAFTLAGALSFAELASAMPEAGGMYVWLTEAYGEPVGFLYGWAYFLVVASGALAALAIVFAEYVGAFVGLGAGGVPCVAIGAIVALATVNAVGVRLAALVGDALTLLKMAAIAVIVGLALGFGGVRVALVPSSTVFPGAGAMATAMIGVFWSYGGWQHASFAAAEARNARRDVPLAMVLGMALVTLVYVLTNLAYLRALPMSAVVSSPHVASDAVEALVGRGGARFVAATVAASALGTAGIYTMTAPRLYWAMADRGLFFRGAATVHPTWRTPTRAIALQTGWAVLLVLAWGTFESLISYVLFVDWIFFGLAGAAVIILRRRGRLRSATYRVPGYPLVPVAFVGVSAWFVASTLSRQPKQALAGVALLGLGLPVYTAWKRRVGRAPSGGR